MSSGPQRFAKLVEQLAAEYEKLSDENRYLQDQLQDPLERTPDRQASNKSSWGDRSVPALRSPSRRYTRTSNMSEIGSESGGTPFGDLRRTFVLSAPSPPSSPLRRPSTRSRTSRLKTPTAFDLQAAASVALATTAQLEKDAEDLQLEPEQRGRDRASMTVGFEEPEGGHEKILLAPRMNSATDSAPLPRTGTGGLDVKDGTLADESANRRHVAFLQKQMPRAGSLSILTRNMPGRSRTRLSISSLRNAGLTSMETRWVINPEQSHFLQRWDVLTMVALVFVALCVPVHVSMVEAEFDWFFFVSCGVDLIFFIDMCLQFFLMYPRRTSFGYVLEHNHSAIVKHYVKGWFVIDFISIFPVDVIGSATNNSELRQMKAVKVIRLLRLLKLARLARAARLARRFEARASIPYGKLAILKFFGILLLITHWLANLWALTLMLVDEYEGVPRWIDSFTEQEIHVTTKTKDTAWKLYITCLYFTSYTITSVGYGDIGPKNIVETIVATVMIVVSGISWAVVLGQVCGIVANLGSEEQDFRSRMDELNNMMEDRVMDAEMRRRLRTFFLSNRSARRRERQRQIISEMSPGLQGEVVMEINKMWISKVSMLSTLLNEAPTSEHGTYFRSFVVEVSLRLNGTVHAQSEVFGQPQVLYILILGLVARRHRICKSGAVWGLDFMLADSRLVEPFETFALTYVELTTLKRKTFMELVQKHGVVCPEIKKKIRYYCAWLSLQRTLLREARKRQLRQAAQAASIAERRNSLDFATDAQAAEDSEGDFGERPVDI